VFVACVNKPDSAKIRQPRYFASNLAVSANATGAAATTLSCVPFVVHHVQFFALIGEPLVLMHSI
jgi:hypothetical protein